MAIASVGLAADCYVNMQFRDAYPTTIELDTSAVGAKQPGGYTDNSFGDLSISGGLGTNYAQNNLIFRASHVDPAATYHQNICYGKVSIYLGGFVPKSEDPSSFNNYGNWDLKWTFDYAGTASTYHAFTSIRGDVSLRTVANAGINRSNLEVVVNNGSITTYNGFIVDSDRTFLTVIDEYLSGTSPTFTQFIANAWAAAGTPNTKAITLGLYNTYNGDFITVGGTDIAPLSTYELEANPEPIDFGGADLE